jgi:predicted CoA-substrate-specific enzyme activase
MIYGGLDVGSLSTDAVLIDEEGRILAYSVQPTGASSVKAATSAFEEALRSAGIPSGAVRRLVSTGYGRARVDFAAEQVTEITCHARGARYLFPETRTVLDIGGQDSKGILLSPNGRVLDFAMNDKCAAGTGRFLEVMARALEVDLCEMGERSLHATEGLSVSSTCTVFAESEVVGLIAEGHGVDDIIRAIHRAIAARTAGLIERLGVEPEVTMTGGVAKNIGVVKALEERLGHPLNVYEEPQIVGALGAALIASERDGG